jgi:ketosteroid isomerase-like protein
MMEKDILALEEERFAAMIARDFPRLQLLVHDELMYTHSSGVVDGKATWLDSMKSGRVKYRGAQCTERKVRLYGDTALITGRAQIEAEIGGEPKTLKLLFLNAWTKTPQGWKFVAWQSTPLPA